MELENWIREQSFVLPNSSEYPVFLESMGGELEGAPSGCPNGTSICNIGLRYARTSTSTRALKAF